MAAANLISDEGIEAWIAEHEPHGETKLLSALERGEITGARARFVTEWFNRRVRAGQAVAAAAQSSREERATAAAERAARWAGWALFMAAAALLVSAWPYIIKFWE